MKVAEKYTLKAINGHNEQYVNGFFVYIDIKKNFLFMTLSAIIHLDYGVVPLINLN